MTRKIGATRPNGPLDPKVGLKGAGFEAPDREHLVHF